MPSLLNRSCQANKEAITLIWFDSEIKNREKMLANLRIINDCVLIYTRCDECLDYIRTVPNEKLFLIIPAAWLETILPKIVHLQQIDLVFVFCAESESNLDMIQKYSKIAGVFTEQQQLEKSIKKHLSISNQHIEAFSFYDQNQKASMDLSERTADFLWLQLFHHAVLRLPPTKKAKQEMIDICRQYYHGNEEELKLIEQFERSYTSKDCIHWYTRETFVYKMVNKALRTEDIEQLYLFRFYINDLSSAIAYEHKQRNLQQSSNEEKNTIVYRGTLLTQHDFEQFQMNEGKLITINGYFSTSRLREIAEHFLVNDAKRKDCVSVLFEIDCNGDNCAVFADIAKFSDYPFEQEVLFDLGAVFKIELVRQDKDIWIIYLNSTSEGRDIAKEYVDEAKKDMPGKSEIIFFGSLLIRLGYYEKAEMYFQQLLKDSGKENLAHIYNQLGLVYRAKTELDRAMKCFQQAYFLMKEAKLNLSRDMAHVLRNLADNFIDQRDFHKAIHYCQQAMNIFQELDETDYLNLSHCLHSFGLCYFGQELFEKALDYYKESLNMKQICLPDNHIYIAEIFNSIGLVHFAMKNIEKALNYYLSALEIYQKHLPENHPDLANVLHNIAECFQNQNQFDKALRHYELALKIKQKSFHSEHPSIATTFAQMSNVFSQKGDKDKALELCLKALKIRERTLAFNHPDLATSYSNAGLRYEAMNNYQLALEYFQKALDIRSRIFSNDDPLRKQTERHIFRLKQKLP